MSLSLLLLGILTLPFTGYQTRLAVNESASQFSTVERSTLLQHPAYVESKVVVNLKKTMMHYERTTIVRALAIWYYKVG